MNYDELGLIVQTDGGGENTAQRTSMYYYATGDRAAFNLAVTLLETEEGFVPHPTKGQLSSFTQDQADPLIFAAGAFGRRDLIMRLLRAQLKRGGRYQDGARPLPQTLSVYARALHAWFTWPQLLLTDLGLLLTPVRSCAATRLAHLEQARTTLPTPAAWLARKLYSGPPLEWLNREAASGNPEIAEAWLQISQRF